MRGVVAIAAWMFASAALGLELNGAIFPDRVRVAPEGPGLSLNGAGERWIWVFKIYAIGLYLPQRKSTMSEVIAQQGPKRLLIIMQRDVTGWQVRQHLANRLQDQDQAAEMSVLKARMDDLVKIIDAVGVIQKDGTIALDWVPGKGTVIRVNDVVRGEAIPGDELYHAFLRIWLSDRSKSLSLRDALLGKPPA